MYVAQQPAQKAFFRSNTYIESSGSSEKLKTNRDLLTLPLNKRASQYINMAGVPLEVGWTIIKGLISHQRRNGSVHLPTKRFDRPPGPEKISQAFSKISYAFGGIGSNHFDICFEAWCSEEPLVSDCCAAAMQKCFDISEAKRTCACV